MSFAATPQRPLPGAYFTTPAPSRFGPGPPIRQPSFTNRPQPPPGPNPNDGQPNPQSRQALAPQALPPVQRAARTINEVLQREASFPDLDSYVRRKWASRLKEQS
jgi:nuclear pore complex protein Nup155